MESKQVEHVGPGEFNVKACTKCGSTTNGFYKKNGKPQQPCKECFKADQRRRSVEKRRKTKVKKQAVLETEHVRPDPEMEIRPLIPEMIELKINVNLVGLSEVMNRILGR